MNRARRVLKESGKLYVRLTLILIMHLLLLAGVILTQQNVFVLRGEIRDQQSSAIAGAEVTLRSAGETDKPEQKALSDGRGAFQFEILKSGNYLLQISAPGFGSYEEKIELNPRAKVPKVSAVLYPVVRADVEVEGGEAGLDAARAAGTQILNEKEIENLPDDPDRLNEQLQNLAASGGSVPGQATVTVDGFLSGDRLPPKSTIRSVKINPNLYSAEYDTPPYEGGRIEIITKPGSSALAGSAFFNGNPADLNARDPFAATRAATNTIRYGFNLGMPVIKNRAGLFIDYEHRRINEFAAVNALVLDSNLQGSNFFSNVSAPKRLIIGAVRADWQINQNHQLVFRTDFNRNDLAAQGIGGTNLPERGFDSIQTENSFRLTETAIINPKTVNELRVGMTVSRTEQKAASEQPAIVVAGSFAAGGAGIQELERTQKRLEITDYVTTGIGGKHNLKFGAQIYNRRNSELRAENTNGTFFFGGESLMNGSTQIFISSLEQYRRARLSLPGGVATQFSVNQGAPRISVNQWRIAAFAQSEWRLNPKVLLSAGLRYEAQTAPADYLNFAPRIGLAYAPDKKQNWSFRALTGVFYDRIDEQLTLEAERLDGIRQRQITIDAPPYPNPFAGGNLNSAIATRRIFAASLRSPASLQLQFEAERRLGRDWKISTSYSSTRGWHNLRSRNVNAPLLNLQNSDSRSATRPSGINENVLQFESSGNLSGRILYVGIKQNSNKFYTVNAGYLDFDFATDADSAFLLPQSSYDSAGEWARPVWQIQHRLFIYTTFNLPRKLHLSAALNATSGSPYNVTTGRDNNGDGNFNDRPSFSETINPGVFTTKFGFLNPNLTNGNLPRNAGTNPAFAGLDLNLSRQFILGKTNDRGENRYKLTFNIRAANALNRSNLLGVTGVLSSPFFGQPTTARPARRIEFGLRFNF